MGELSPEAKAELDAAIKIYREDHVIGALKKFMAGFQPKVGEPPAPVKDGPTPPPVKDAPVPPTDVPPKKASTWWGEIDEE
jgi:hypothetical protein